MSEKENEFLKNLRSTLWTAFGGLMMVVIMVTVPFYFNTNNQLEKTKEQILELKESKADKQNYEFTVRQIQKDIKEINDKLDK